MTVHKLSAGDGYRYLTRQVASADQRRGGAGLAGYYSATGTPPGRWLGASAADLGVSGQVSEPQMVALFGVG
ncbi:MAG: relaxase domain-containing protein [Nocardioidaceae bacterium]|nr:relaxase domain-containing protein [Nocardioidaceae bacterium]